MCYYSAVATQATEHAMGHLCQGMRGTPCLHLHSILPQCVWVLCLLLLLLYQMLLLLHSCPLSGKNHPFHSIIPEHQCPPLPPPLLPVLPPQGSCGVEICAPRLPHPDQPLLTAFVPGCATEE
ncbi:unnamed protein product [Staurois parvus]|uniref:Uncharacterized protein n=1 Tax=Staurois parvus TaxID=386267 RepID=A0ABN9C6H1_9NEOB|nr:unnamed protein product [Staurois parvus]